MTISSASEQAFFEGNRGRPLLAIRADANLGIGTGHVMRCVALAQAWQDAGGCAAFICAEMSAGLEQRLNVEGISVYPVAASAGSLDDAQETAEVVAKLKADWLAIDGFQFGQNFIDKLQAAAPILLIDDHHPRERYDTDVVLNPNIFATAEMYSARCRGAVLAGPAYALLRREFRVHGRKPPARPSRPTRLLVTMGGSDPDNVSLRILKALNEARLDQLEVTLLCGAANPHMHSLQRAARESKHPVKVVVDVTDMACFLQCIDVAISAPGGTCLELACLGVPMLLIVIAENHERTAEEFAARGLALSAGWHGKFNEKELALHIQEFVNNPERNQRMAKNAASLIDGRGAGRVISAMLQRKMATGV